MCAQPRKEATAVWFSGPRTVELRQEQLPPLRGDDIRVRTLASAISHGTEMLVYRGEVGTEVALDLPTLSGAFSFPIKYGYATVGRVQEVGTGVDANAVNLKPGNLVFVHHPHQTEFVVPASMAIRLPDRLDPERGVFLANAETALNVMLDAHPRLGETVLIFGQGVVGLLTSQMARLAGAGAVIAVEPSARRRDLSRLLGVDAVLQPDSRLTDDVKRRTGGVGADLVIEVSGSPQALSSALECVATQGTVVVASWYGTKLVSLPLGGHFHRGRVRMVSSQVGMLEPALQPRWTRERRAATAQDLLERLELLPMITHRIPFAEAAEAYRIIDEHADETVQVLLSYV